MRRRALIALAVFLACSSIPDPAGSCTIGVMNGSVTVDGRPLLWKNRDADLPNQEVRYFNDGSRGGYLAVVTTGEDDTTTSYVGVNDAGFSIMNSNALNIVTGSPSSHGILMKRALMECESVADFEALLIATSGTRGHIWANFGCIDRFGNAVMFEANDWEYRKYDAAAEGGFVVRANAAVWGGGSMGSRYDRALLLVSNAIAANQLSYRTLVQTVAKDLGGPPSLPCGQWSTNDPSLSRYRTRSAGVVQGVLPGEDPRLSTLWCTLGEPSCGITVPLWSYAAAVPPEMLTPGQLSPMCAEIQQKKLQCYTDISNDTTIDTNALVGDDGLGGIQGYSLAIELDAFNETDAVMAAWRQSLPPAAEVAQFQADRTFRSYQDYDAELPPGGIPDPGMVAVLSPNGGESWQTGDARAITWSKSGNSGALVDIELLRNGTVCATIASGAQNGGTYAWTVSRCDSYTDGYAVRVTDRSSGNFDDSDGTFSIVQPVPVTLFTETFETTVVPGSVWSATDTNTQSGLDYWGNEPVSSAGRAHGGSWSAYCAAHSSLSNQKYDNSMTSDMTLINPIDLAGYTNVQLSFWLWFKTSNSADYVTFEYKNGSNWVEQQRWSATGTSWRNVVYDISGPSLQFRFRFITNRSGTAEGAYVDDIVLTGTTGLRGRSDLVMLAPARQRNEAPPILLAAGKAEVLATDGVLLSSAPNPFRPATELSLTLPAPADAKLEILAVDGRRVCVLHEGGLGAGDHRFAWRGTDADGRAVPSGTYYARLRAGNRPAVTARLVLIR